MVFAIGDRGVSASGGAGRALLGLGTATVLPGLLLPLLLLAPHRPVPAPGRRSSPRSGWLAVNLPVMLAERAGAATSTTGPGSELNTERGVDWGTFWYVGQYLTGNWSPDRGRSRARRARRPPNWLSYALFGLACLWVAWLTWAPRRPRLAALAFLVVAAFLLVNKVWSQQFVLWLLPLVVLARPRWGAFLAWQAAEVIYFFTFYGQLLRVSTRPEDQFLMPEGWFIVAASLRWLTVAVLCLLVVRDILQPRHDVVRQQYPDDPDGGVFDGAPDRISDRKAVPAAPSVAAPG